MPWGAAIGALGSVAASSISADKKGGAGTTSSDKAPWQNAQPLLVQTLNNAYGQQARLQQNPLSGQQLAAYDNSYALSDYARDLVPSLLSQQQANPLGYDPRNPTARPKAFDWNAVIKGGSALGNTSVRNAQDPATPAAAPVAEPDPVFSQQTNGLLSMNGMDYAGRLQPQGEPTTGSYGTFKYGMDMPKAGSKEYRDMSAYFANGGEDPYNIYQRAARGPAPSGLAMAATQY